jgi:hypothetical protein
MAAAFFNFSAPLSTRPITSTRSSSRLLMLVLFNETSCGWRSQSKGTFQFVRGHYQRVSTGNNFDLCEIIFAEDKKFALLSQNYRRFGLDEPKAAPALPLTREYRSAVIALSRQTFCICCAEKKACQTRQALTCKQKLDSG